MASTTVSNLSAAVGAGAAIDIRPPVGEAWLVDQFGSDAAFVTGVPDLEVRMTNAATYGIILSDPTTDPGRRTRSRQLYLTRAIYATMVNRAAGAANLSWYGTKVNPNIVRSGTVTIGATAYATVRPPVGETWIVTDYGMNPFTVAGDINPAVEVGLTDGTLVASRFILPTMTRGQEMIPNIVINHDVYLNLYSTPGGEFYYSAIRVPYICISSVTDVVGSANLDIQPPAGYEYVITAIGAETWAGAGAPADLPDIIVSERVGANDSEILEDGALVGIGWNTEMELSLDNTHFMRITENSTANNEVCISGYISRIS